MTAPTHISFAAFIYLLLLTAAGVALSAVNGTVVAFSSLLPDLDTGSSRVGRALPWISSRIERRFGHRTLTHSAVFMVALALAFAPLLFFNPGVYVCLLVGYASHPILDTMTVTGVQLFYPLSRVRCVFPLEVNNPRRYRAQTGSKADRLLCLAFLIACVPAYFVASQGYVRFVRATQRSIESAVRDYNEISRHAIVYARLKAHDLLSKATISGRYVVVGTLDDHTLLIRGDDGLLHTLGREYQSEYAVEHIMCEEGPRARVRVRVVDISGQSLWDFGRSLDPGSEHQFFGIVQTADRVSLPALTNAFSPIRAEGGTLQFSYASLSDIESSGISGLWIEQGLLTVRTIATGDTVPKDRLPDAQIARRSASRFQSVLQFRKSVAIEILRREGDTVWPGQLVARVDPNAGRTGSAIESTSLARLEDIERRLGDMQYRIGVAGRTITADSLNLRQRKVLYDSGFVSFAAVDRAGGRLMKSRFALQKLLISKAQLMSEAQGLLAVLAEEERRDSVARTSSEMRSTVRGIIRRIHIDSAEVMRKLVVTIEQK